MESLKVGIVEDDLLIAESIAFALHQIGYGHTAPVRSYAEALQMIAKESPDILLIDIIIEGDKDGIDLAHTINRDYDLPFIFLTANSDHATVARAKEVNPYAYLIKPFTENDLYSAIEIAISNYNQKSKPETTPTGPLSPIQKFVFIKEGDLIHKLEINQILYIESENVYLNIFTAQKRFVIRAKLDEFILRLPQGNFIRIHRSYAINLNHLDTIQSLAVIVGGKEIPLNKAHKQELLNAINLLK